MLLADATQRTPLVAEETGIDEEARDFSLHYGFEASPSDPVSRISSIMVISYGIGPR